MSNAYLLWKMAHILSASVLLGTGIGIAFFCWFGYRAAQRSGNMESLRAFLRLTVIADAWLTAPAVIFQAVSGVVLTNLLGWPLTSPWATLVWALFLLVGVCWLPMVAIQVWLKRQAELTASLAQLPPRFRRVFCWWFMLGIPAFVSVVAIFYLMVAKPLPVTGT